MLEESVGRGGGSCLKPKLPLQAALQAILYISRLQEPLAYLSLPGLGLLLSYPHLCSTATAGKVGSR